jgi:hypothetical protein
VAGSAPEAIQHFGAMGSNCSVAGRSMASTTKNRRSGIRPDGGQFAFSA